MLDIKEALEADSRQTAIVCSETARKPSSSELLAISKLMRRDATDGEIYTFPALAIDETPTRNGVIYSAESQRKSLKDWYGIPFLFNPGSGGLFSGADHELKASSQFGRIYKAQLVDTGKGKVGTLLWIYSVPGVSEALAEFCNKIDTGILREVSIHVMADQVECSICGKQFGEDGHSHWPMEKYGNETAYMKTVGKLTPLELSSVACPGSTIAHVMSDEDAADLKLLPLREALGGSRAAVEAIMNRKKGLHESSDAPADGDKDDDDECGEDGQPGKKGGKSGAQPKSKDKAGEEDGDPEDTSGDGSRQPKPSTRTQSADPTPGKKGGKSGATPKPGHGVNKDGDGSEDMDEADDDECDEATDPDDEPETDDDDSDADKDGGGKPVGRQSKSKKKESLGLFAQSEVCVVCNRSDVSTVGISAAQRESVISEYREEVEGQILAITDAAKRKVDEADRRADNAERLSGEARAMREYFVNELVDLSVSKGLTEASRRATYAEELLELSWDGLKILRETVNKAQTSRETRMEALEKDFRRPAERFATEAVPDTKSTAKKSRFAATIGPN